MNGTIWLEKLACIEERDPGAAEPYLWAVFYRVDRDVLLHVARERPAVLDGMDADVADRIRALLDTLPPDAGADWLHAPGGAHGNIGPGLTAGKTRLIPSEVGFRTVPLEPGDGELRIPARENRLGLAAVLLEQDNTPDDVAGSAYDTVFVQPIRERLLDALEARARSVLTAAVRGEDPGGGVPAPLLDEAVVQERIEAIREVFERGTRKLLNRDDIIGGLVDEWTATQLFVQPRQTHRLWREPESEEGTFRLSVRSWVEVRLGEPSAHAWSDGEIGIAAVEREGSGRVVVFRRRGGREDWTHLDVNFDVQAPPPVENAVVAAWNRDVDGTEHVAYRTRAGIVELFHQRHDRWRRGAGVQRHSAEHGVRGAPCGWVRPEDETQHLAYVDGEGRLRGLWFHERSGWQAGRGLYTAAEALTLGATRPAGFTWDGRACVVVRDEEGRLWLARSERAEGRDPDAYGEPAADRWELDDLCAAAGAPPAASDPAARVWRDGGLAVAFADRDGRVRVIQAATPDDAWSVVEPAPHGPPARGRPALTESEGARHVVYRDAEGALHEARPAGDGWRCQRLEAPETECRSHYDPAALPGPPAALAYAPAHPGRLIYLEHDPDADAWSATTLTTGPTILTKR